VPGFNRLPDFQASPETDPITLIVVTTSLNVCDFATFGASIT
jgi:hypothetical protein